MAFTLKRAYFQDQASQAAFEAFLKYFKDNKKWIGDQVRIDESNGEITLNLDGTRLSLVEESIQGSEDKRFRLLCNTIDDLQFTLFEYTQTKPPSTVIKDASGYLGSVKALPQTSKDFFVFDRGLYRKMEEVSKEIKVIDSDIAEITARITSKQTELKAAKDEQRQISLEIFKFVADVLKNPKPLSNQKELYLALILDNKLNEKIGQKTGYLEALINNRDGKSTEIFETLKTKHDPYASKQYQSLEMEALEKYTHTLQERLATQQSLRQDLDEKLTTYTRYNYFTEQLDWLNKESKGYVDILKRINTKRVSAQKDDFSVQIQFRGTQHEDLKECTDLLWDIKALCIKTDDDNDDNMSTYVYSKSIELLNTTDTPGIKKIKEELVQVRNQLEFEMAYFKEAIATLEKKQGLFSVGVGDKIKAIKKAALELPVEQRLSMLSSKKATKVQEALGQKRGFVSRFFAVEKNKEGEIIEEKAARTFREVKGKIKEERSDQSTNKRPK